jgi:hypothetical protein
MVDCEAPPNGSSVFRHAVGEPVLNDGVELLAE